MKKKIVSVMAAFMLVLASSSLVYAAEEQNTSQAAEQTQTYSWVQEGEVWKLKDAAGNVVVNSWYKDTDGSYYYLMEDGSMLTGILYKDGNAYYLGEDGRMVVTDGVYHGVSMTFDKDSNGEHYGNIISGLGEIIFSGVRVTNLYVSSQTNDNTTQQQSQEQNVEYCDKLQQCIDTGNKKDTADAQSLNRAFTQEELARMKEALDQIR